jgi:hypothetical protein
MAFIEKARSDGGSLILLFVASICSDCSAEAVIVSRLIVEARRGLA